MMRKRQEMWLLARITILIVRTTSTCGLEHDMLVCGEPNRRFDTLCRNSEPHDIARNAHRPWSLQVCRIRRSDLGSL